MLWQIIIRLVNKITTQNIYKGTAILVVLLFIGTFGYSFFESETIGNGLWWSFVTMTTVGYGDLFPKTTEGRILAVVIMTAGIGVLGAITAGFAGYILDRRLREIKGMKELRLNNHFLIIGWNYRGKDIIDELKADKKFKGKEIVIIANIPESPMQLEKCVHFVSGEPCYKTLENSCAKNAQAAIILTNELNDPYSRDAKSILSCLTLKKFNPLIYTSVELYDPKNEEQCKIAGADEIIVSGGLATNLLVQSVLDTGVTKCVNELLSNRHGQEIYKTNLLKDFEDRPFSEILLKCKKDYNFIVIGIESAELNTITTNPSSDMIVKKDDKLIVIAEDRPEW
jgi:voltage-gated potassium channel